MCENIELKKQNELSYLIHFPSSQVVVNAV